MFSVETCKCWFLAVLLDFIENNQRYPDTQNKDRDIELLLQQRNLTLDKLKLGSQKVVGEEFAR